jgi:PAS domain-containing protein
MTLEERIQAQIERNEEVLAANGGLETAPQPVYITDVDEAAYALLGLTPDEFETFLAGVVCRPYVDWGEVDGE